MWGSRFDDWLQPDLMAAGRSAQDCLSHLMALVGIPLAACMHPSCPECHDTPAPSDGTPLPKCKRKAFRQIQDGLGVTCDLSRAEKGFVDLSPTAGRCEKLIRALREHETSGRITPSECEQLMGKLTFSVFSPSCLFPRCPSLTLTAKVHLPATLPRKQGTTALPKRPAPPHLGSEQQRASGPLPSPRGCPPLSSCQWT